MKVSLFQTSSDRIHSCSMCKKVLGILLILALGTTMLPAQAVSRPANPVAGFRNLSADEVRQLSQGQTVFRQPDKWKDLSVPTSASFYREIEDTIRKGGHNYIGEVILVLPTDRAEELLPMLKERLLDFEGYAGIPYWSKREGKFYDLFTWVRFVDKPDPTMNTANGSIETIQFMKPFGEYGSHYAWIFGADTLSFSGVNTTALSYDGVRAVSSGNMLWRMSAYRQGDYWVFYGLGAVKAFDMFGVLRERLSTSFMGRIEAFFRHAYNSQARS